jgi:hypothetical protein
MVLPLALSFARSLRSHRWLTAGGRWAAPAMSVAAADARTSLCL